MKVVAFNSSPNMDKGNTALILNPFLQGMKDAGAEVDLFYTRKLKVKPCLGELDCWFKTPGRCFQKDDMAMINEKAAQADILVCASPLYVDGYTGPMKNLLDRMVLSVQPYLELRNGKFRHPKRAGIKRSKAVLVSNCGFWEIENFKNLVTTFKELCDMRSHEYAGALLRPHGPILRFLKEISEGQPVEEGLQFLKNRCESVEDVFEAAAEAGRQLVGEGKMSTETLNTVSRVLIPKEVYLQKANERTQRILDALKA